MQFTQDELRHRTGFHPATAEKAMKHEDARATILHAMLKLNDLVPDGREKALMMTHLDDAMHWGNKGIACND